ncbi:S-layer homology domain-containing protein, partial [Agathobaculum sp.]|uniref:S-layer homology domain-containing protein n=1 Tax=Agathobaculum sp. TaxID=2048138 RepID=UPI003A85BAFD
VTVTGYDYAKNFVSEKAKSDGSYGQKLVIEFTITPDLAKLAQDEAVKVDTNTGAGLYLGETAVAKGESGKASFCGVKYDANGGKGTVPATEIGANGKKFNVPASCDTLKKDKAVLLGFSATKREALVTSENDATGVVTEYTPANNTLDTLYAVWAEDENGNGTPDYKEKKYTITYAAGTEDTTVSGMPDAVTDVLASTEQTVSTEKPTREGYIFSGWQAPEGVTVTDNKFTMPAKNVTFTAQWTANDVTITFDANGGAWAADVAGYTMGAENKTASKKFKLSDTVEKITPDPANGTKKFVGWGVKLDESGNPSDEIVAYPLLETSATAAAHKRIFGDNPIIFYAIWDDAAQPTEKLNYTTRQHYIDEKGNEVATVDVGGVDLLALQGTKISDLIKHLETDQNYFGQKYLYDGTKTTVNNAAYKADTMTLDTKGTAIDLYYYLDEWNDEDDTLTGGDGTPDKYQALVKFESADATKGTVAGTGAVQVFTFKNAEGEYLTSGNVTPSLANVTTTPADGFAFDIWTKDKDVDSVNPEATMESVPGGTTITFKAHFAADKIGSENKPDNIPDKYQAVVTYKVVGGTWKDGKTDAQVQVFTLKTKNADGAWVEATPAPVLGDTIPTGMISSYSRTASQSWDKDITKDTKVTESVTYTYTFTKGSSGGGGSSSTHYYISLKKVDAQDGEALSGAKFGLYLDGKQIATATSDRNGIVRFSMGSSNYRSLTDKSNLYCQELTAPEGYKLSNEKIAVSKKNVSTSSSTSDKNAKTVKNSRSKTPSMLNGEDHFAYIVGYPDKTVHPQSSITRAEVATIFFRLLTEETRTANATKTNNYADVSSDNWYNQAVSTLSAMGIIKGDSRGNFNPNTPITRAEFAAIAARFDKTEDVAAASFGDVAMHWAKPEISVAANNGWINGYTDGTFHPDSKITRAEAMAMINRVLQRLPESKADLLDGMIQWSDNADTSKWYYLAVQEATNSHYYELKANQHEKWTKLRENRDWTELEK